MILISLTDEEKQQLLEFSQNAPELLIRRARLILAYADGKPTLQSASESGISRGRARFWKRQFLSKRMDIFNLQKPGAKETNEGLIPINITSEVKLIEPESMDVIKDKAGLHEEIPYPTPLKEIGVSPDDTLAEAGRKVWLYHFAVMLSHEEGTLVGEAIEELHDMRVATRRMRTAFDVFGPAYEPKIMKHYLKGLRTLGRALGQVRDMDVLLDKALNYQRKLDEQARPGIQPLIDAWRQTVDIKRLKIIKHLRSEAYRSFKQEFNRFLQGNEGNKEKIITNNGTVSRIRDIVPVLVYSRYAAVRAYETIIPTASVNQLHALRIEFKKFRYTLEYFREILNEGVDQAIKEIKQLQDHLGELHDADVACDLVKGFLKEWDEVQMRQPIPERLNSEPIVTYLAYLHAERYRLILSFPELWINFSRPEFRQNISKAISLL